MSKSHSKPGEEKWAKFRADLTELYLKFEGRNIRGLIKAMHERGHTGFSLWSLYTGNGPNGKLIKTLKLKALLTKQQRAAILPIGKKIAFPNWLERTEPNWTWTWPHQKHLYPFLEKVTRGEITRLMIFMPPRHGKTELATVRYAAWRLERDPRLNIILGSYNQRLANRYSRKIKRIASERIEIAADRSAVDEWETTKGGGVSAVGVGAGVTGFGADLVLIDDPIKSRAEAESANNRDRIWDWFKDDIHTRLEPRAAVILIQTRWHEDDLAGRLIRKMEEGGEKWTVVSLPALAEDNDPLGREPGAALCPKRFDREELERKRQQQGANSFNALNQQRPSPADGNLFKRHWFGRIVERAPAGLSWARGYDLAVSTKTTADHTASFRCAFDSEGNLYIADGFRRRIEYPDQRRFVIERMRVEPNTVHGIEKALHGQALVQDLRRDSRCIGKPLRACRVESDKYTRALSWASLAEDGKVILVQGAWIDEFIDEAVHFPGGVHDDQIDAVSLAVSMLSARRGGLQFFD